jgi:hypothetical protein
VEKGKLMEFSELWEVFLTAVLYGIVGVFPWWLFCRYCSLRKCLNTIVIVFAVNYIFGVVAEVAIFLIVDPFTKTRWLLAMLLVDLIVNFTILHGRKCKINKLPDPLE